MGESDNTSADTGSASTQRQTSALEPPRCLQPDSSKHATKWSSSLIELGHMWCSPREWKTSCPRFFGCVWRLLSRAAS